MRFGLLLLAPLAVLSAGCWAPAPRHSTASTGGHLTHDTSAATTHPAPRACPDGPAAGHSRAPFLAFDTDGKLWAAWEEGGHVWVSSSTDSGASFSHAVKVNPAPERVEAGGESGPKLALGPHGQVWVTWTRQLDRPHTGAVRFARSEDAAVTFLPPRTLGDDPGESGQRFDTLLADGERLTVAWIDKRDRVASPVDFDGASVFFCESQDGGRTFSPARRLVEHACECCRLAGAIDDAGRPVLLWRHVFEGSLRDHALLAFTAPGVPGELTRASFQGWHISGCPHHGPALAVGPDGAYHLAWWSGGGSARGVLYARGGAGRVPEAGARVVSTAPGAGHPAVLATRRAVWLAWLESDSGVTRVMLSATMDDGKSFAPPVQALASVGPAGHPALIADRGRAVLAWFNDPDGLRVVDLGSASI